MPGRNGFLTAFFIVLFGAAVGAGAAHATSTVTGYPGSQALRSVLAKASYVLDQSSLVLPDDISEHDVVMLALNIYYEARGEGLSGKAAVAFVTLNRLKDGRFPATLSEVILQPKQFSWTSRPPEIQDWDALRASLMVAAKALTGVLRDRTGGALYFHAAHLGEPEWIRGLPPLARIGAQTFYAD